MRGLLHTEDFSWSAVARFGPKGSSGGGGNTSTVTQQSGPPPQVLANYQDVYNQGKNVASQPYPTYNGALVAGLQPQQVAGFNNVNTAVNAAQPFLNAASQYTTNAAGAMDPSTFQATQANYINPALPGFINQAQSQIGAATGTAGADVNAALARMYGGTGTALDQMQGGINNAVSGMAGGVGSALDQSQQGVGLAQNAANQFSQGNFGGTVGNYYNPYAESVVAPTQRLFNEQNAQQLQSVRGNAAAQGAFGGDREAIAEAETARQQSLAQDPVLAQLQSTGYAQAVQNALAAGQQQQQAAGLTLQGAGQGIQGATAVGNAGLQGATALGQTGTNAALQEGQTGVQSGLGLGNLTMTGAGQTAGLGNLSNQGYNAATGALQSDAWLNSNAGFGMGNLGQEVQNLGLSGANALISSGGMQQQQAQAELNAPYQQWLAAQGYPYQATGWLEGLATGTGALSGSQGSTTSPGPSTASQIAGLATTGAGLLGQSGAFGESGWLNNAFSGGTQDISQEITGGIGAVDPSSILQKGVDYAKGGRIPGLAAGGTRLPFDPDVPALNDVPDLSISVIPQSNPMAQGASLLKPTGSTSTTTGSGSGSSGSKDSIFGTLLKGAGTVAAGVYGGPGGAAAANALGSQVHFGHGGRMPRRDMGGGIAPDPVSMFGGNPNAAAMYQRYDALPTEHLHELAQRAPNDPYIRRALMQRTMAPQSDPAMQPQPQQPGIGFAGGGGIGDDENENEGADINLMPIDGNPGLQSTIFGSEPAYGDAGMVSHAGGEPEYSGQSDMLASTLAARPPAPLPQAGLAPAAPAGPNDGAPAPATGDAPTKEADAGAPGLTAMPTMTMPGAAEAQPGKEKGFPWGTLTAAGLGIMGGTSPFAAVNIGRGGLEGLKYAEAQRLREAQLESNRLWHQGQVDVANRRATTGETRAASYDMLNQAKVAAMKFAQENPKATNAQLQKEAMNYLVANGANPADAYKAVSGLDIKQQKEDRAQAAAGDTVELLRARAAEARARAQAKPDETASLVERRASQNKTDQQNANTRAMTGGARAEYQQRMATVAEQNADTNVRRVMATEGFQKAHQEHVQWLENHQDATLAQAKQHEANTLQQHLNSDDLRIYLGTKDDMGRPTLTMPQAHQRGEQLRSLNAPAQAQPAQGQSGLPQVTAQERATPGAIRQSNGHYAVMRNGVVTEVAPP